MSCYAGQLHRDKIQRDAEGYAEGRRTWVIESVAKEQPMIATQRRKTLASLDVN